jgi:hypothetical protein
MSLAVPWCVKNLVLPWYSHQTFSNSSKTTWPWLVDLRSSSGMLRSTCWSKDRILFASTLVSMICTGRGTTSIHGSRMPCCSEPLRVRSSRHRHRWSGLRTLPGSIK